jgi:hypothetical protein
LRDFSFNVAFTSLFDKNLINEVIFLGDACYVSSVTSLAEYGQREEIYPPEVHTFVSPRGSQSCTDKKIKKLLARMLYFSNFECKVDFYLNCCCVDQACHFRKKFPQSQPAQQRTKERKVHLHTGYQRICGHGKEESLWKW